VTSTDVVISGYGPVGQALAAFLGRRGHRVIVVERHPTAYPTPRAGHFDHEIMRLFQSLGIAEPVGAIVDPALRYELLDADGTTIAELPRRWQAPSGWEPSYHFYQPELERILDETARAQPGVEVMRGWEVEDWRQAGDEVRVGIRERADAGRRRELTARYLVGADGANSAVRERGRFTTEDLGFHADWLVVDVRFDGAPVPALPHTGQICDPSRPATVARLGGPYVRWEFMLVEGDDPVAIASPESVWKLLSPWAAPPDVEVIRSTVYTFRSVLAEPFRDGRALLAGDAAHLMPPFLGQGMCSGLRDAQTLSWMLDMVLRGDAPDALLDSYGPDRGPHARAYIEESVRIGRMVCETDPVRSAAIRKQMVQEPTVRPPFQPAAGAFRRGTGPLAGTLAWQPRVSGPDGSRLLDDVLGAGFHLLGGRGADDEWLDPDDARVLEQLGVRVAWLSPGAPYEPADDAFDRWLAAADTHVVLVRPDHVVYGQAATPAELHELIAGLRSDLGPVPC
jgi:2-polyprenyl-6-methoxyphenol hydroxylase-like FAD-dependent oxidoreductase